MTERPPVRAYDLYKLQQERTSVIATVAADCIGPYRAIRQLGAGGMGEVFLAHDDELGRNIAIKLLPPHLAADVGVTRKAVGS